MNQVPSGPEESTPKMVRFCALCGEREDNPTRSQWCDPDPAGTDYPYMHRWGNPQEVKS